MKVNCNFWSFIGLIVQLEYDPQRVKSYCVLCPNTIFQETEIIYCFCFVVFFFLGTQVKPVRMCDKGLQYDPPPVADQSRTKETMCNLPEEEKVEQEKADREKADQERAALEEAEQKANEEELMEVEEETSSDNKKKESSDYKPDSSESSSDYQSTPQKPRKRLCKS